MHPQRRDGPRGDDACIKLQKSDKASGVKDYYVRTYVALGDARTKEKKYDQARKAWRDGLALFPESTELTGRLAILNNKKLLAYIESKRNLQKPVDTSLAFLDPQQHGEQSE